MLFFYYHIIWCVKFMFYFYIIIITTIFTSNITQFYNYNWPQIKIFMQQNKLVFAIEFFHFVKECPCCIPETPKPRPQGTDFHRPILAGEYQVMKPHPPNQQHQILNQKPQVRWKVLEYLICPLHGCGVVSITEHFLDNGNRLVLG